VPIEQGDAPGEDGHRDGGNQAVALQSAHVIIVYRMLKAIIVHVIKRTFSP
jgi:hypothetical protein